MENQNKNWTSKLPSTLVWILFLIFAIIISSLIASGNLMQNLPLFGSSTAVAMTENTVFSMRTEGSKALEWNEADKVFFYSEGCTETTVMAAKVEDSSGKIQAAICTCLNAEEGKGWYCWN